jgi:predicted ATP-dependent endonuclease of OLD family
LKQYISLKAFLATKESSIPPILLIDEAEVHLHYSAQSDLVIEFEKQKIANSIIYTTHSAGCLPSDLGTGIRVVEPIIEGKNDTGISKLNNSIWQNSGGFSPLLLAMGANIIAFTLARKAIIAEGPSETILLPRLLREVTNLDYLDFQVAPGIASISKADAKSFELEAAKVVYLIDGDNGGNENRKKLRKGGIEEDKIMQLPENYTIEDFVNSKILAEAINRDFEMSGKSKVDFEIKSIPTSGKIKWFESKCAELNLSIPNKVKIAENISKETSDISIFDQKNKVKLIDIYKKLSIELNK